MTTRDDGPSDETPGPTLLARLWLARLRGDAAGGAASWAATTATSWPAAIAIVRACVRADAPELALALCDHYESAMAADAAKAAELDYLAAGAARALRRERDAVLRYERIREVARTRTVPVPFLAGACYHLAAIADAAGDEGRARELAAECLRLIPDHRSARELFDRVRHGAVIDR
jgi:hypothetical protein